MILPMTNDGAVITFEDPEHPTPEGQRPSADLSPISPGYFRRVLFRSLQGRDFSERDDPKSLQVMIVNQAFAQKFFPGEEVLGKKLKPGAGSGTLEGPPWREIVGVVGDIKLGAMQRELRPAMYVPACQVNACCCVHSVVCTSLEPISLEASGQRIVAAMDEDIPVTQVRTMNELMFSELA